MRRPRHRQLAATTPERNRRYLAERDSDAMVRQKLRDGINEFRRMLEAASRPYRQEDKEDPCLV